LTKKIFRKKADKDLRPFKDNLDLIISPQSTLTQTTKSIDLACGLFYPEAMVEVSSLVNPGNPGTPVKRKIKLRSYLTNLSVAGKRFDKVEVTYTEFNYSPVYTGV